MSTQSTSSDFVNSYLNQSSSGDFAQNSPSGGDAYVDPRYSTKNDHRPVPGAELPPLRTEGYGYIDRGVRDQATELQNIMLESINSPDKFLDLQKALIKAKFLSPKAKTFIPGDIQPGDATYYALAEVMAKAENTGVSYKDLIAQAADKNPGAANYDWFLRKFGPDGNGSDTANQLKQINIKQTDQSNGYDAQAILNNTMQTFHGRDANPAEVAAFTAALHAAQVANPTVTTGTYDPSLGYRGDRDMTTQQGLSSAAGVQQFAKNYATTGGQQQEYNQNQIQQYVDAFQKIIRG